MQTSSVSPVTNSSFSSNTTNVTKTQEQILIQSSGAMIALIVIGIIFILAILLIILKTYNKHTHVSRVLGPPNSKLPPKTSQSMSQSTVPLTDLPGSFLTSSINHPHSDPPSENGLQLARGLSMMEGNHTELSSTNSGSTLVSIHAPSSIGNT